MTETTWRSGCCGSPMEMRGDGKYCTTCGSRCDVMTTTVSVGDVEWKDPWEGISFDFPFEPPVEEAVIEDLRRADITEAMAREVTLLQVKRYLIDRPEWEWDGGKSDENGDAWTYGESRLPPHPAVGVPKLEDSPWDPLEILRKIADAEDRGEAGVWLDVKHGERG